MAFQLFGREKMKQANPVEKSRLRQNVESIGLALLIALVVRSSVVQAFWVPSGSMLPTIQIGDHIFVNKLAYAAHLPLIGTELFRYAEPSRGDIVVFVRPDDPNTDLIKRIVAIGGDTVEIRNKVLHVNGEPVEEPHVHFTDHHIKHGDLRDNWGPQTVPEGMFFVLGDNRDRSYDGRYWGFAHVADIKGRATFVYWSREKGSWPRFERFGHFVQ